MKNLAVNLLISSLFITVLFNSCISDEEELLYPDFATISIDPISFQALPQFTISGEIKGLGDGVNLTGHGDTDKQQW